MIQIENVLILDTETTGIEPCEGGLLEIGAIFYNVPTKSIIQQFSTLLYAEANPAFEVNKIEVAALKATKSNIEESSIGLLSDMMIAADAIIAHNAEFDKNWIKTLVTVKALSDKKKWICTRNDFTWPVRKGTPLNLIHIAVDLGVPVVSAHRALTDCQLIASCFSKLPDYELLEKLRHAMEERKIYIADVSYDDRQKAKDAGFIWNELHKNAWAKKMTEKQASEFNSSSSFKVRESFGYCGS